MAALGTRAWSADGGQLRSPDRLRMLAAGLQARLAQLPAPWRRRALVDDAALARMDPAAIPWPDTVDARAAFDRVAATHPAWLTAHVLRTYAWASLFAQAGRHRPDVELLYVAALLHDVGLVPDAAGPHAACACFAVAGARAAEDFALGRGWPAPRAARLHEAIALHLNVRVPPTLGVEAHLLHEGAALDVVGARRAEVPRAAVAAILAAHPRGSMTSDLVDVMKAEVRRAPDTRLGLLVRLGFLGLIRRAWPGG